MSDNYNPEEYIPTIDAILSVANLEKVSVKKIRNAIQELFDINFQPYKKEINEAILERYYKLLDERENEAREEEERAKVVKKENAVKAVRLQKNKPKQSKNRRTKSDEKSSERRANNAFFQEKNISPELQAIIGMEKCSRPQIVKQLWAYIKDNNLQNPEDKRKINCDEKLQTLFKKQCVGAFEMNKLLSSHIFASEEKGSETAESTPVIEEATEGALESQSLA